MLENTFDTIAPVVITGRRSKDESFAPRTGFAKGGEVKRAANNGRSDGKNLKLLVDHWARFSNSLIS
ncbi:MAG: hypothetical protein ACPGVX_05695 [Thalassobaculaceae bacterium]